MKDLCLIEGSLLYNIVLVSATHQHESATGIRTSPPSWTSLPPPTPSQPSRLLQSHGLSSLSHTANSHWLCILHMVMYVSVVLSQFVPPSPSPTVTTSLFLCLHPHCCPANRFISTIFLDSICTDTQRLFFQRRKFKDHFQLHQRENVSPSPAVF